VSMRKIAILIVALLTVWSLGARPTPAPGPATATPTVFLVNQDGRLYQLVSLNLPVYLMGNFKVSIEQGGERAEASIALDKMQNTASVLAPACAGEHCPTRIEIRDAAGELKSKIEFDLPYQRRWKIHVSPFSHIDVGFTNSQRKILAQNLDNLRAVLKLIEETKDYPEGARFKFFTEVSWPTSEFLYSDAATAEEKQKLIAALKSGQIEVGGFLISHQNKFLPAEALFRSPETALKINRDYGVPIRTACINDVFDFSGIVKPLYGAQIPYFIGGANTNHYVTPPLFYLQPPVGNEKILVWLTPNLNGYGENTDLAMKPDLPITDAALDEIEHRLGPYLKSLETDGVPPKSVRAHFDFYGAHWSYPYDIYFLPFDAPHAPDNGPQDITASDLAKLWNSRWAYPKLIVATPAEFFQQAEAAFKDQIPTLRGDLPGFWGEQIFFAQAQVDPEKSAIERDFARRAFRAENEMTNSLLYGRTAPDVSSKISEAYKLILLNNDHNPGPVPFGNTQYTKEDTKEWKETRRNWIALIKQIGSQLPGSEFEGSLKPPLRPGEVFCRDEGGNIVLENQFYRLEVDGKTGGIPRLFDKELDRELVGSGPYQLNQYVIVARGEDAGTRGNLFHRPGFKQVKVEIIKAGPEQAAVRITGIPNRSPDGVRALTKFIQEALGLRIPSFLIKGVARLLKVDLGPVEEVSQEISLSSGDRGIQFIQNIKIRKDQIVDHTFAYPLNVPPDRPLIVEGPYNPYRFGPAAPLGNGDLIPGAKMMDTKFQGINALTQVFGWMYGMPPDAVFDHYVLALGKGFGVVFTSDNSGVILPGPLDKDPVKGPFGGGFSHLVLGWTAYGRSFLGAPREGEFSFHSRLTSFAAKDEAEAKSQAARFGLWTGPADIKTVASSNSAILVTMMKPLSDRSLLLRLYETRGKEGETEIILWNAKAINSASRARSDGVPLSKSELKVEKNAFSITLGPGEVATVRVELK